MEEGRLGTEDGGLTVDGRRRMEDGRWKTKDTKTELGQRLAPGRRLLLCTFLGNIIRQVDVTRSGLCL